MDTDTESVADDTIDAMEVENLISDYIKGLQEHSTLSPTDLFHI